MTAQDDDQGSGRIANVDENVKHIRRGGKKVMDPGATCVAATRREAG